MSFRFLLDTNICIYIIKKRPAHIVKKFHKFMPGDIAISSVSVAELYFGVFNSQHVEKNLAALQNFLMPLEILAFDENAAMHYGQIRSMLQIHGTPIGSLDLMIAAHARSISAPVVTNNTKEFNRVPELKVENWLD